MFAHNYLASSIAVKHRLFNSTTAICLHTVKWLNSCIWPQDGILTGTTTLELSGPESYGNEGVFHIPKAPVLKNTDSDVIGIFYCSRWFNLKLVCDLAI